MVIVRLIHECSIYGLQTKIIERNNARKKCLSEQNIINEITFNEGVEKFKQPSALCFQGKDNHETPLTNATLPHV